MPGPITLESLRLYAAEVASADVSSLAGDREIQQWINQAIQRLWREHDWNWAQSSARLFLDLEETGTALNLTAASRLVTLTSGQSEAFKDKYLSETWNLHVSGEGNMTFELSDISDGLTATLKEGHQWVSDTEADATYAWSRHIYPLPEDAKRVVRVELMQNRVPLAHLTPGAFDQQRQSTPTQRGNDPIFYTFRKHRLEVWPAPGTAYKTLLVTCSRGPTTYTSDDPDSTEVDWEPDWDDLLRKAIVLEASITQGKNAPIPYRMAKQEYDDCLATYRDEDGIQDLTGSMSLRMGTNSPNYINLTTYPSSIPEVG